MSADISNILCRIENIQIDSHLFQQKRKSKNNYLHLNTDLPENSFCSLDILQICYPFPELIVQFCLKTRDIILSFRNSTLELFKF